MQGLIHGGDLYGQGAVIDFSANINPLGLPQEVQRTLMDTAGWAHYPDPLCRDLSAKLAAHEGVLQKNLRLGNGAADLIYRIAYALHPRHALTLAPTFSEYARALEAVGCMVKYYPLSAQQGFLLGQDFLEAITPELDLCVLCNPNNPTGQPIKRSLLQQILEKCMQNGVILLVDECFVPFLADAERATLKDQLSNHPNLIILRAFTKFYAMAGLRLGYLLCSNETILNALDRYTPPWNISTPAQAAGLAALDAKAYARHTGILIAQERAFLKARLKALGCNPIGEANYLFFAAPEGLRERLRKHGILIRCCGNYPGLTAGYYRVAVRTRAENEQLLLAMQQELEG